MLRSLSLTAAAALVVGSMNVVPAAAHDVSLWTGSLTFEEQTEQDFGGGNVATIDQTLTFSSSVNLADETVTTMTFQGRYQQFTPARVAGADCSRTDLVVGGGTVPARVTITSTDANSYQIRTEALAAIDNVTTTITFAGPSFCADVITSVGEHSTGANTFTHTPAVPPGLDPLTLAGTASLGALQQGISVGPVEARWSFSKENGPPVGVDDTATTDAGVPVDIDALANDTDPDGDKLDLVSVNDPLGGTAFIERGTQVTIRYFPDPGFVGDDVFGYVLTDSHGEQDTASIRVSVTGASGTVVVRAETLPSGASQPFVYSGAVPATLSDGQSAQRTLLAGSVYNVTQAGPVDGWDLTGITCTNVTATVDLPTRTARFTLPADTEVTCTFTNRAAEAALLTVSTSLAYTKPRPGEWHGGETVEVLGTGAAYDRVRRVCVVATWSATIVNPRSTTVLWNGKPVEFLDNRDENGGTSSYAWSVASVTRSTLQLGSTGIPKPGQRYEETVVLSGCVEGVGSMRIAFPNLLVAPFAGGFVGGMSHSVSGYAELLDGRRVIANTGSVRQPNFRPVVKTGVTGPVDIS